jgi:hypothetical protein
MSILVYNGQSIEQRDSDAMVNITEMAKANNVLVGDWLRLKSTDEYIKALSSVMGIPITDLMVKINGSSGGGFGTWAIPELAIHFGQWVSPEFHVWCNLHIHRLVKSGRTELESDRRSLELAAAPDITYKAIKSQDSVLKQAGFPIEYRQRLALQLLEKINPKMLTEKPEPREMASLPTTKALLNPTQIGEAIDWYCKSNQSKGDARRVNSKLAELGYQESIGGRWSATDKAIDANLVDRKPVNTDSRTQKDQLLWSADILPILREHSITSVAA